MRAKFFCFSVIAMTAACQTPGQTDAGNGLEMTTIVDGFERSYLLYVPSGIDAINGAPLVINVHGLGGSPEQQNEMSGIISQANVRKFVVAAPLGLGPNASWNAGACCTRAKTTPIDDVAFFKTMLKQVSKTVKIDPKRVYGMGISNGGMMLNRFACDPEGSQLIAGIASVSGGLQNLQGEPAAKPASTIYPCKPSRPVSVILIGGAPSKAGKGDECVPFLGGLSKKRFDKGYRSSQQYAFDTWSTLNGASGAEQGSYRAGTGPGSVACKVKTGNSNSSVTLCSIENGAHWWPGNKDYPWLIKKACGGVLTSFDATKFILEAYLPKS